MTECPSGKVKHSSVERLKVAAHVTVRSMNQEGIIAKSLYGYTCPDCRKFHLTKRAQFEGKDNFLVMEAPPLDLQQWVITGVRGGEAAITRRIHDAS